MFGPGFGECIALHLGGGNWAIVDSCLDATSKQPTSLHYLTSIGANPATFKLPHHGSPTGDSAEVWSKMAVEQTCAITTPFVRGSVRLPSLADCQRILSKTQNAYLSAPPLPGKFRDSNKAVERTVQEATRLVQFVPGKYGHVRLRKLLDENPGTLWRVELFGSAVSMADYVRTTS